jgi:hypothetical protein
MKRTEPRFVVCGKDKIYAASLELRKLYHVVWDADGGKAPSDSGIDESGGNYL